MTRKQKKIRNRILVSTFLLAAAFAVDRLLLTDAWGLTLSAHTGLNILPLLLTMTVYLPSYLVAGYDVLLRAARNIRSGQVFDENLLMCVATLGALAVGFLPSGEPEFAEASFVMLFYQTGELFQSIAVGQSRKSIAALMDIRPDRARVLREGGPIEVSPEEVAVGERILLRAGDRVPLDAVVLEGASDLDTVALTGEALPRAVTVGARIHSGCTNLSGVLVAEVTAPYAESTVSRVLELVENAVTKKSKSEQFITRFAAYYTPLVVLAAVLLAFLPPIFLGFRAQLAIWLTRALTFLVISCPCALVISVPLAFFGGIGGASRMGVLAKGSRDMETLARVEICAFDKTGTLTKGRFSVCGVYLKKNATRVGDLSEIAPRLADTVESAPRSEDIGSLNGDEKTAPRLGDLGAGTACLTPAEGAEADALLALAAAVELHSTHPVGCALVRDAKERGLTLPLIEDIKEEAGKGLCVMWEGKVLAVGNAALLAAKGIRDLPPLPEIGTAVYVAHGGALLGAILVSDQPKPEARDALAALRDVGVSRTVMLTGDREGVARAVAAELGIAEFHAALLPADKVTAIEGLLAASRGGAVAFVGDGINDAPVLARADVGIAMGGLGADVTIEAADVVLMDDDPRKIAAAIHHARRTLRIVRQNITLALSVKGAVLLCSALGLLGALQMPLAVFADVGVAVIAILNAMRALKVK